MALVPYVLHLEDVNEHDIVGLIFLIFLILFCVLCPYAGIAAHVRGFLSSEILLKWLSRQMSFILGATALYVITRSV